MDKKIQVPQQNDAQLDTVSIANVAAQKMDAIHLTLELLGRYLHDIKTASESQPQKVNRIVSIGSSVELNFKAQSVYVDNSNGANAVSLVADNRVSFEVAAGQQQWVHPLGCSFFDTVGNGNVPMMFVDTFLPIK